MSIPEWMRVQKSEFLIGSAEFAMLWPSPQAIWKINFYGTWGLC